MGNLNHNEEDPVTNNNGSPDTSPCAWRLSSRPDPRKDCLLSTQHSHQVSRFRDKGRMWRGRRRVLYHPASRRLRGLGIQAQPARLTLTPRPGEAGSAGAALSRDSPGKMERLEAGEGAALTFLRPQARRLTRLAGKGAAAGHGGVWGGPEAWPAC